MVVLTTDVTEPLALTVQTRRASYRLQIGTGMEKDERRPDANTHVHRRL